MTSAAVPIPFDGAGEMEVDLSAPDLRIAMEIDGSQHLGSADAYRRDRSNAALLQGYGLPERAALGTRIRLVELLQATDVAGLEARFHAFFATIPHDWYRSNDIARFEGYYASVFYSHFAALGLDIRVEDTTNHGRIDMTVLFEAQVWIFEFKVVELAPEGRALQQIRDRGYADKYRARGEPIHLVGVEFSRESRNIVGFAVESLVP